MSLHNGHKEFIEGTISYIFDLPNTADKLRTEIGRIVEAISAHTQGEYEAFSRVFQNPRLISRIDDYGALTIGEAREYMVEYVGGLVADAAETVGKSPQDLGWNQDEILEATRARVDHGTNLEGVLAGLRREQLRGS